MSQLTARVLMGIFLVVVPWRPAVARQTTPSTVVVHGVVVARSGSALRVEIDTRAAATPAAGDSVAFGTTVRGIEVAAGKGLIERVEGGFAWVRVLSGNPGLKMLATIRARPGRNPWGTLLGLSPQVLVFENGRMRVELAMPNRMLPFKFTQGSGVTITDSTLLDMTGGASPYGSLEDLFRPGLSDGELLWEDTNVGVAGRCLFDKRKRGLTDPPEVRYRVLCEAAAKPAPLRFRVNYDLLERLALPVVDDEIRAMVRSIRVLPGPEPSRRD